MGRDQSGRGGLPPAILARVLALARRDERLSTRVICARTGVNPTTVRRVRRAAALLNKLPQPPLAAIARQTQLGLKSVRLLAESLSPRPE